MAPRSNKNSKTSSTKKQSTAKKAAAKKQAAKKYVSTKRTVRKKQKTGSTKKGLVWLFLLFAMVSLVAFGYYLGQHSKASSSVKNSRTVLAEKTEHHKHTASVFSKLKTKRPDGEHRYSSVKKDHKAIKAKAEAALAYRSKKPKLVIIIDDVSNARQLKQIRALGMPITPSIFPPSHLSMSSHKLARGLKHYMIHLPMESGSRQFNKQYKTLKTSFSAARMEARIKEMRKLFPTAHYINNHTGSVFTGNYRAMYILYGLMKKEGFRFIDSRTTASTKVKKIAHQYGDAYVARDVFIDNIQNIPSIHKQLKKAVKIAKQKGYAVVIGHPHKTTMQALASAKNILKDVELVYIDQIYQP
ncbi:divergent polysaccharide deacetylase family protein [Sulfurovum sp.]|uniref:divergent polysaccharide deacetylase family protein n=1 Tax=Sulfurovum sp. TaxID=1969726 RepID=UPI0025EB0FF6|nr:divergent polysaccharide deacetylase family protein [Sulfurovum sp.]